MTPTCPQCTCGGAGCCGACQRIRATVARESASPAGSVAAFLATSEDAGRLAAAARAALDDLTTPQRQVLVLRLVDHLPLRQVARRLALPQRAVPGLYAVARARFSQHREVIP